MVTRRPNRSASQPPSGCDPNAPTPKQVIDGAGRGQGEVPPADQVEREERLDELAEPVDDGAREQHPERPRQPAAGWTTRDLGGRRSRPRRRRRAAPGPAPARAEAASVSSSGRSSGTAPG